MQTSVQHLLKERTMWIPIVMAVFSSGFVLGMLLMVLLNRSGA